MRIAAVIMATLFAVSLAFGQSFDDCFAATCRVTSGTSIGTGCIVKEDQNNYYVLTAHHVVKRDSVALEFWRTGYTSEKMSGRVYGRWYDPVGYRDIAIVAVAKSSFGRTYRPKPIPLAPPGFKASSKTIRSIGCSRGSWPTAFEGHITRAEIDSNNYTAVQFKPIPATGRSGSAVFSKLSNGQYRVSALIAWQNLKQGCGIAQPIDELWAALRGSKRSSARRPLGVWPISTGDDASLSVLPISWQISPALTEYFCSPSDPNCDLQPSAPGQVLGRDHEREPESTPWSDSPRLFAHTPGQPQNVQPGPAQPAPQFVPSSPQGQMPQTQLLPIEGPDLSQFVRRDELSAYAKQSELNNFAKRSELEAYAKAGDLHSYAKASQLGQYAKRDHLEGFAKSSDLHDYAKQSHVDGLRDHLHDKLTTAIDERGGKLAIAFSIAERIASRLGLELAIPGGVFGVVAWKFMRIWLHHRRHSKRIGILARLRGRRRGGGDDDPDPELDDAAGGPLYDPFDSNPTGSNVPTGDRDGLAANQPGNRPNSGAASQSSESQQQTRPITANATVANQPPVASVPPRTAPPIGAPPIQTAPPPEIVHVPTINHEANALHDALQREAKRFPTHAPIIKRILKTAGTIRHGDEMQNSGRAAVNDPNQQRQQQFGLGWQDQD